MASQRAIRWAGAPAALARTHRPIERAAKETRSADKFKRKPPTEPLMIVNGGILYVEQEIARGGFGVVERVRMGDGTLLARKTFAPQFPGLDSAILQKLRARFEREVRVQSSLNSPSFIPILHADLTSETPWYLMPLADRNFQQQIEIDRASGVIPSRALADVLNALEELHKLGFVHRDLKPQNVLLHDAIWKLTDFGLVLPTASSTTKLTSTDSAWGTALYCAPEQARDFRGVGAAADIYAYGCILHDIFVNSPRVPYSRQTAKGPIGSVIEKCTELRPDKRFKSVQALRSTLLTLLSTTASTPPSQQATEWANDLATIATWQADKAERFARYVAIEADSTDRYVVFKALDEDALTALNTLSDDTWKHVVLEYTDWISVTGFAYEYCDVLVKRLEHAFHMGDLECKGAVALAAAELASSHNRWFAMGYVMRLCGPSLDESAAQRIAIEIRAAGAKATFKRCASVIGKSPEDFHPLIATALAEDKLPHSI